MNERTNITDQGYSYGGKDYVYETRTNPVTNTPYQVALEKSVSKPTMQSTTAQRNADVQTQVKYDELASSKGITTPSTPAGWSSAVYGDPTKPSTITGYDNPEAKALETKTVETVQPWTPSKDDTPEITAAKNNYKSEQEKRDKEFAEIDTAFNELKANSPIENQLVMDKIKAKYAKTKAILEQNMANLAGLHEKQGYATGGNRYTQMQSAGILTNDANNLLVKMSELDSQEAVELLEASQARKTKDWDMLQQKMSMIDKINDNKTAALKALNDLATSQLKSVNAEKKATEKAKLMGFTNVGAYAKSLAPTYAQETLKMDDVQLDAYVKTKAEELGIDATVLKSAVLEKRTALQKKATTGIKKKTVAEQKSDFYSDIGDLIKTKANLGGIPVVDPNGFITPKAFEIIVQKGAAIGQSRKQISDAYKSQLYGTGRAYNIKK